MARLVIGDSLDKGVDIGALVDPVQLATIKGMVEGTAGDVYQRLPFCPWHREAGRVLVSGDGVDELRQPIFCSQGTQALFQDIQLHALLGENDEARRILELQADAIPSDFRTWLSTTFPATSGS